MLSLITWIAVFLGVFLAGMLTGAGLLIMVGRIFGRTNEELAAAIVEQQQVSQAAYAASYPAELPAPKPAVIRPVQATSLQEDDGVSYEDTDGTDPYSDFVDSDDGDDVDDSSDAQPPAATNPSPDIASLREFLKPKPQIDKD